MRSVDVSGCVFIAMAMTSFIKISVALNFRATDFTKLCLESKQEDKDCIEWTGFILFFFKSVDREVWACTLSEHVFRWPIHPTPERCTLQHRKLSHSAAETSPVLRSCLVSESSECIEFRNNISILMTGCSVRLWPALLPQFLKEQMTQRFELRANGDLYLCMTCFRSPGGGGPRSHMPVGGKVVQHRRQNLCSSG